MLEHTRRQITLNASHAYAVWFGTYVRVSSLIIYR